MYVSKIVGVFPLFIHHPFWGGKIPLFFGINHRQGGGRQNSLAVVTPKPEKNAKKNPKKNTKKKHQGFQSESSFWPIFFPNIWNIKICIYDICIQQEGFSHVKAGLSS